jgi:catechol 2,3-dioxygenase-like lactoylglutathione lyase family enzyme
MLQRFRVHTTLPAQDLERARDFYVDTLGLEPSDENPNVVVFDCADGTRFILFKSSGKASGDHTQVGSRSPISTTSSHSCANAASSSTVR